MSKAIRSPIITVLGHVDHGKTTLLDAIRGTGVAKKEAGRITQMIGASYMNSKTIASIGSEVAELLKIKVEIPGILFIDTPGHEAFCQLRERGGSIADFAVLVVDITQGFQPQTLESLRILKECKTPFLVAANKIDLITGWKVQKTYSFLKNFSAQKEEVKLRLDEKIYTLVGNLSEHGFDSERFDRVSDFSKQLAIVPISAKERIGLAELLLLIAGMSQKYMLERLRVGESIGRGTILEMKEVRGIGPTLDVILHDGILRKKDPFIFLTPDGIRKTHIRALLEPKIKGSKEQYSNLEEVHAAAGVKVVAPDVDRALPGSPFIAGVEDIESVRSELMSNLSNLVFEGEDNGIIVKADSLGSLDAILYLLKKENIPVKSASIGSVSKKDVLSASAVKGKDRYLGVILAFNVPILEDAKTEAKSSGIPIMQSNVIYKLLESYSEWKKEERERELKEILTSLPWPVKLKVLPGFVFRMNKPAIFGVEVLSGTLKKDTPLMNEAGQELGKIKTIQMDKNQVPEAKKGEKVAISSPELSVGRGFAEGSILYTFMSKKQLLEWKQHLSSLSEDELNTYNEIRKRIILNSLNK